MVAAGRGPVFMIALREPGARPGTPPGSDSTIMVTGRPRVDLAEPPTLAGREHVDRRGGAAEVERPAHREQP